MAELGRPRGPRRAVALRQRAPQSELLECLALLAYPGLERLMAAVAGCLRLERAVQAAEGVELQAVDGVAVDAVGAVEGATGVVEGGSRRSSW